MRRTLTGFLAVLLLVCFLGGTAHALTLVVYNSVWWTEGDGHYYKVSWKCYNSTDVPCSHELYSFLWADGIEQCNDLKTAQGSTSCIISHYKWDDRRTGVHWEHWSHHIAWIPGTAQRRDTSDYDDTYGPDY